MKLQRANKGIILSLYLLLVFLITGVISAKELSIEEAIELGLENSKEIKSEREIIRQEEKALTREIVSNDWQISFEAGYDYNFTVEDGDITGGDHGINPTISGSKTLLSGLNFTPNIKIDEDLDPSFGIGIKYPLYPQLPSSLAEEYYRTERNLLKAHSKLTKIKANSIISWLETYLNINRMASRQKIYQEGLLKAEANLANVLERKKIGDAGKNEILAAELGLENARYSLLEAGNGLEDTYFALLNQLGLSPTKDLTITDKNQYLDKLRKLAQEYAKDYLKEDIATLMDIVEENNNELVAYLIDREVLEQELKWIEKGNDPSLDMTLSYDTDPEDLSLGLKLSYQLYDGGLHKMALDDKEEEIADNISNYEDLYDQLKQELKKLLDRLELSEMAVKRGELSLARSEYELEVAEKQLEMGLIDYLEYQDYWITAAEAEIEITALEDELFLSRMEFIKFLDQDLIFELLGGIDG